MINKAMYLAKVDELIALADKLIEYSAPSAFRRPEDAGLSRQFYALSEQFVVDVYGENSPMHKHLEASKINFSGNARPVYYSMKGVLVAIKQNIEQGWLDSAKNQLSAEIFGDYLDMAKYLNNDGFYIAAAVIAGTTLEERLRQLCLKHGQPIEAPDSSGKMKPLSAEQMNGSLVNFYKNGKADVKRVTDVLGQRNDAAHGNWNADPPTKKQFRIDAVDIMIQQIELFIAENPI